MADDFDRFDPANMAQMPGIPGFQAAQPAGGVPHLLDHLWAAYAQDIQRKLEQRRRRGQAAKTLAEALRAAPATHFWSFCVHYLDEHRPVQQFWGDANAGVMLSNNQRVLLCPPVDGGHAGAGGQMQDAGDVGVTHGRSQPGLDGVVDEGGGIKII